MSDYVDTILLEANRKSSPEYRANLLHANPSHWTNDLGSGVQLDIGDKISVHSSFISEIGNESSTIEIKGSRFPVFKSCSHTVSEKIYEGGNGSLGNFSASYSFESKEVQLKDNEINLTQSYYKTTNGEYYITLPRFGAQQTDINESAYTGTPPSKQRLNYQNVWNRFNASVNGSCQKSNPCRLSSDYSTILYDKFITGTNHPSAKSAYSRTECINDGKRHTLFVRDKFSNYIDDVNFPFIPSRDPALAKYKWFKKTKTYDVTLGFNSPANVAVQLTEQMREITNLSQTNIGKSGDNEKSQRQVNLICETNSNELFPAGISAFFDADSRGTSYLLYESTTNYRDKVYESNWGTIGYKRPELQEQGRILVDEYGSDKTIDGNQLLLKTTRTDGQNSIVHPLSSALNEFPNIVPTQWEWNDSNLLALKTWFETQLIYPELFSYADMSPDAQKYCCGTNGSGNISIDKVRWFHFNVQSLQESFYQRSGPVSASKVFNSNDDYTHAHSTDKILSYTSAGGETMETPTFIQTTSASGTTSGSITSITSFPAVSGSGYINLSVSNIKLGSDYYLWDTNSINRDKEYLAAPIFVDFNKDRAEINDGLGENFEKLRYGFATRIYDSVSKKYYIGFRTDTYVDGLSVELFDETDSAGNDIINQQMVQVGGSNFYQKHRSIGFDKHFNAFGTCAIMLYNGDAGAANVEPEFIVNSTVNTTGKGKIDAWDDRNDPFGFVPNNGSPGVGPVASAPDADPIQLEYYKNQIYIGANNPSISFNAEQSRFIISDLHSPEYVGNLGAKTSASSVGLSSIQDANVVVYKLNKRLRRTNYTPSMGPYNLNYVQFTPLGSTKTSTFEYLNDNIIPYSIMDAHSGISFEEFNVDQYNWVKSLYALMGFSWEQFNSGKGNRLDRFSNVKISPSTAITTNATISSADTINFALTHEQDIAYDPPRVGSVQWIVPEIVNGSAGVAPFNGSNNSTIMEGRFYGGNYFPAIEQLTESTQIIAQNLPRKMLSPIYLIKSDLISPTFLGGLEGRNKLPVIDVVPKSSGYGDFFNGVGTTVFTNTIPRTIQNITTQIVDADGTASRVDDSCCVIYQIEKTLKSNQTVLNDILNPPKK